METKFNFKSQVCTSRFQTERLLALGLKKETRDAVLKKYIHNDKYCYKPVFEDIDDRLIDCNDLYPAWSLHRLVEMMPRKIRKFDSVASLIVSEGKVQYYLHDVEYSDYLTSAGYWKDGTLYDNIIDCIEWLIKKGYFNKEYLV